ncbi:histidine phosphatase family protein [Roseateles sp. BYS180W]|uniref:Histidine phosphatase family protein n=1 Tax=Roseateles rivi TaxID=3299028 RepID=A0ABW7FUM0_9BURK
MLEPCHLLLVRHGQTAWNVDGRMQGHLDIPLDAVGRAQALAVAQALADEPVAAVVSSDLLRARHTADAIAATHGLPVLNEPLLRERHFGVYQGLLWEEVQARWPQDAQRWSHRDPDFAPEGGESLTQFSQRCVEAVTRHAQAWPGRTLVLATHGGVLDCLYRAATGQSLQAPRSWMLGNTAVNRLLWNGEGLSLVGWNDTRHLETAGAALDDKQQA